MSTSRIPLIYRLCHLYIEPLTAINGAYLLAFAPQQYHLYMPQTARYSATSQIVYTQLASMYVFMALIECVVLHVSKEMRVWKAVIYAALVSDIGHNYAMWAEMGTDAFFNPTLWTPEHTMTMVANILPVILRIAFVLGVGFPKDDEGKKVI